MTRLIVEGNTVYAGGAAKVIAVDARSGKLLWSFLFDNGSPTRLVILGDRLVFGSDRGGLFVLDRYFGKALQVLGSESGFGGDLIATSEFLYALSRSGTFYLYQNGKSRE